MRFADSLWLSATATQRGWNQMVSYSAAFYGTAALQTWKLGMDAPLAFWQAIGRAGERPAARTPMRAAPARKPKPAARIDAKVTIVDPPAPEPVAKPPVAAPKRVAKPAKTAKTAAKPAKAAAEPVKAVVAETKVAAKPETAVVTKAKPAGKPVKAVTEAKAPPKPAKASVTEVKAPAKPVKAAAKPEKAAAKPIPKTAPTPVAPKAQAAKAKPEAAKGAVAAPEPVPTPPPAPEVNTNPRLLDAPRGGKADDLTVLSGVGDKLVTALNDFGIFHFDQIAELTEEGIDWINAQQPGFKALTKRFDLVSQARARTS